MKIKLRNILSALLSILILVFCFIENEVPTLAAQTATFTIVTSNNVTVGNEFVVTIQVSASARIEGYNIVVKYDANIIENLNISDPTNQEWTGGPGQIILKGGEDTTLKLRFKAKSVGNTSFEVKCDEFIVSSGSHIESATCNNPKSNISVVAPYVASSNNNLASLTVGGATLSPAFNAATTTYSCNVAANISTLVVTAKQADSKAKVAVAGNTNLKYGRNEIVVTVTAENGAVKKYVIVCNRATPPAEQTTAAPSQPETVIENPKVIVDDVIYHIIVNPAAELPTGFTAQDLDYKGTKVKGGYNPKNNMYLMYLETEGENKTGAFYVFDAEKDTFTKFVAVNNIANTYVVMPFDSADKPLTGFVTRRMVVGGNEIDVYVDGENAVYGIFYAMDGEGNLGWYRYCSVDGTVQRYVVTEGEFESQDSSDAIKPTGSQGGLDKDMWKSIAIVSMAVALAFLVVVIVLAVKNKKGQAITEAEEEFLAVPKSWQEEEEIEFEVDDELTIEEDSKEILEKQDDFDFLEIEETDTNDNSKNS